MYYLGQIVALIVLIVFIAIAAGLAHFFQSMGPLFSLVALAFVVAFYCIWYWRTGYWL